MTANTAALTSQGWSFFPSLQQVFAGGFPIRVSFQGVGAGATLGTGDSSGDSGSSGPPRHTFEDAVRVFEADFLPNIKPRAATRYRVSIKALARSFAGMALAEITKPRLMEFISVRRNGGVATPTIRRDLACLSSMFQFVKSLEWIRENPVRDLDLRTVRESQPRTRYLSKEEEARLIEHAGDYLKPMIAFAIETGLRLEEQTTLEWGQVNLERLEITLTKTKTNNPRVVPLTERALKILQDIWRHPASPYVFRKDDGSRYTRFTRGLAGAARRAGIPHLRWHDLRRTCGCRLLQEYGMDLYKVRSWLGHRSVMVTERTYAFLRVDDLHMAIGNRRGMAAASGRQAEAASGDAEPSAR